MQFLAGNQTLQSHRYEGPESYSGEWNTATIISATIAIQDIFDHDRIPDACFVSNPEIGFHDQCTFSVYLSPKVNEISEYRSEISFTCCTETDNVPSLWYMYREYHEFRPVNIGEQSFMLVINDSNHLSRESKISVALICGKELNQKTVLYGIGELVLTLPYRHSIPMSGKIKADRIGSRVLNNGQSYSHIYNISVFANSSRNEHIAKEITLDAEVMLDNEMWISIIVILAISLLINIAVCINKCYNIMTIKKRSPAEGSNPQINLRSVHRREEDTMHGVPISSDPPRPADPDGYNSPRTSIDESRQPCVPLSGRKKDISKPLEGKHHDAMAPQVALCSKSLAAGCHTNFQNNATNEESYEALEVNTLERHVYQNLSQNDNKEGIYSVADDRQYSKGNETNFQPTNIVKDHAYGLYSNSDIPQQTRDGRKTCNTHGSLQALPDKPPGLGTVTVGESHSAASSLSTTSHPVVTTASNSDYDCLKRSEIERHLI